MKHSRKVHGHAQHWPTEKLIRAALMLLIAIAAATGLLLSASSLAKSGRKPVRREPSAPTAKSNDAVSDSSRKDRGVSSNGSQVKVSQRDDITPETLQQIAALEAEKSSRTPAEQKIDSQLLQAIRESRGQQMASGIHLDRANVKADDAGRLEVDIATSVNDDLLSKIEGLGGEILSPSWEYKTVRARVSLSAIEAIAAFSEVRFVQPAVPYDLDRQSKSNLLGLVSTPPDFLAGAGFLSRRSVPVVRPSFAERAERVRRQLRDYLAKNTRSPSRTLLPRVPTGVVNSEGDRTHRADDTRNTYGYQGAGVRIGILSDSFNNRGTASTDIANGELPGPGNPLGNTTPVTVLQDLPSGGSDEGRAMVQIVHDLVPKAQLFFATASAGEATFASNIQALRNAPNNCDVIIDDVSYADEPPFQDGIVAQAVNTVTASGALYFASAGNAGSLAKGTSGVFEGDFNDSGSAAFSGSSKVGTIHNFGTVGSPINGDIITAPGLRYGLFWADPLGGSTNDYDLFVVTSAGAVRASSTNLQSGTQNPVELIALPATFAALDRLVVFKTDAAFARAFHLDTFRGTLTLGTNGQTHAHACAVNAFAVAATPAVGPYPNPFSSTNQVETFSSDGPRRVFYNADGSPITPGNFLFGTNGGTLRAKPDVTAADGVSTTLPAGSGLNPFFGTSAAAPHAGAIAGLLKSAFPAATAAQIRTFLTSTVADIESPGVDINSGAGILQAFQAMQAVNPTAMANVNLGTVTRSEVTGNGNGVIEPGETGRFIVQITNPSLVSATSVNATLTTSTAGVTVIQGSASYGTIAPSGSATNAGTPFTYSVGSSVPCGTNIVFSLTVSFGGGFSPQGFLIQQSVGAQPFLNIASTLGQTPPTGSGFTSTSGQQTGRLNRLNGASSCASPKATPTLFTTLGSRQYDAYTFTNTNSTSQCVTVTLTAANGNNLYTAAYNNSGFVPATPNTNYLADPGGSASTVSYSFTAPANQPFTVVVHDINVTPASQSLYTLSVSLSNCAGPSGTPTPTPTPTPTGSPTPTPTPSATPTPGQTVWSQQTSNITTSLAAIHFLNDNEGYAAGPNGIVLRTVNGGSTWSTVPQPGLDPTAGFNSVRAFNQSTIFVGGLYAIGRSTDGGSSFGGALFTNDQSTFRNRLFPTSANVVWAVGRTILGGSGARAHFRYTFTGNSITSIFTSSSVASDIPQDLYFVDADNGWSIGTNGVIIRITNGSTTPTFTPQTSGTTQQLNGIFMLDSNRGWIVGNNGTALRTADGGLTWTPLTTGITNNLNDVEFKDSNNGWAVGSGGIIIATTNGGNTWTPEGSSTTNNLNGVSFANTGYACGANGTIIKRTGAAATNIQFSSATYSVGEANQLVNVTVTRTGDTSGAATVNYATSDSAGSQNCNVTNGIASSRCDYISALGTLKFAAGETSKTISILVINDAYVEGPETFNLTLSNPTGGSLGSQATATVTINDNDSSPGANPIDQAGFFVTEHYYDFLNRIPDADGLAFWTNEINSCGSDQVCIQLKRINVSAAYFLSIEFQQTGYLVERMYKTAFGSASGASTLGGAHQLPVPVVRFNEFLPDTQQIGQGVVVNVGNWQQQLENNKQAFALDFVQRSRFTTAFQTTLSPAQFVDLLFFNAGVTPSQSDRQTAINEFGSATTTSDVAARGRALRDVAENSILQQQEFNRAFVLMQFFGYLRRNPNDPQDIDYTGYEFWLNKLNQFNGNFVAAEMVKAFITSVEYRQRFGTP